MSSLLVEIVKINDVKLHPDADILEIAKVKGWECIVRKGEFKRDQTAIYIPIDSVLPKELSDMIGVTNYLKNGRVRTVKLRGIYSQGLLVNQTVLSRDSEISNLKVGDNVADILGITKYEPPIPITFNGKQRKDDPRFYRYTDIENIKNFPGILRERNEEVVITEKIHGSNFRAGIINNEIMVGSHNCNFEEDDNNLYWQIAKKSGTIETLLGLKKYMENVRFYGEIYGKGVQKLHYDRNDKTILFYDIMYKDKYMNYDDFLDFCKSHYILTVPELFRGIWNVELMKLAEGPSTIAKHVKEGIVIKPVRERYDRKVGRVVLKHLNPSYLLKDYGDLH